MILNKLKIIFLTFLLLLVSCCTDPIPDPKPIPEGKLIRQFELGGELVK